MFLRHAIWSILWAIIIACLYLAPGEDLPNMDMWDFLQFDKIGHMAVFGLFTLLLKVALKRQTSFPRINMRTSLWTLMVAVPYGGILEFIQGTVMPNRHSDIFDFGANVVGCIVGIVIYRLIYGRL
ncbi:MAG: VanZ family protein [Flavobacteriales bacterium]|nr:VanZ family protein [Flavobacteriales bacterium]MDG1781407.1 VanZ family protein [Flavobacteriales bacterium]MDG2247316.1 VanZ family protein [Flavobacteriales bacterium]